VCRCDVGLRLCGERPSFRQESGDGGAGDSNTGADWEAAKLLARRVGGIVAWELFAEKRPLLPRRKLKPLSLIGESSVLSVVSGR